MQPPRPSKNPVKVKGAQVPLAHGPDGGTCHRLHVGLPLATSGPQAQVWALLIYSIELLVYKNGKQTRKPLQGDAVLQCFRSIGACRQS